MTNKIQLIAALTLTTILIASGFSLTPQAFSTGNNGNNDDDKKDKKGGDDSDKFKKWKNEHDDDLSEDENTDKVKVCHIPPGNEGNAHTIEISESALATHLEHADILGACPNDDDEEDSTTITFIQTFTSDNSAIEPDTSQFIISIDGEEIETGMPITIMSNTVHYLSGELQTGYKLVLISGDSGCPTNLDDDPFVVKKGKSIICTLYYDDDFVEGGTVGPNPTVTLQIDIIDDGLGVTYSSPPSFQVDGVDVSLNTPIELIANKVTEIIQTNDNVLGDLDESVEVLPTKITGDGHCPEVLTGEITLSLGQNIKCVFEYGKPFEAGVIFHYDSIKFDLSDDSFGDNCFKGSLIPSVTPCYTRDENTGNFFIVPNLNSANGQVLRTSTLILFTVIGIDQTNNAIPNPAASSQCIFDGLVTVDLDIDGDGLPDGTDESRQIGFQLACTNTQSNPDDTFRLNYALIETLMQNEVL